MNSYDEFKLKGLEAFSEYKYFKNEFTCPYELQSVKAKWWEFERRYHEGGKGTGNWKTFSDYFDEWIRERAAPETEHDLSTGNPWKKEYENFAPYADVIE